MVLLIREGCLVWGLKRVDMSRMSCDVDGSSRVLSGEVFVS